MKKLFLILMGAAAISVQACKTGTADKDKVIDDGMNTSETSLGSGSTRPADRNTGNPDTLATPNSGVTAQDTNQNQMDGQPDDHQHNH